MERTPCTNREQYLQREGHMGQPVCNNDVIPVQWRLVQLQIQQSVEPRELSPISQSYTPTIRDEKHTLLLHVADVMHQASCVL